MNVRLSVSRGRALRYGAAICLLLGALFIAGRHADSFTRSARCALWTKPALAGSGHSGELAPAGPAHHGVDLGATPARRAELAAARAVDRARSVAEGRGRLRGSSP